MTSPKDYKDVAKILNRTESSVRHRCETIRYLISTRVKMEIGLNTVALQTVQVFKEFIQNDKIHPDWFLDVMQKISNKTKPIDKNKERKKIN